jgi:hypothetical protein
VFLCYYLLADSSRRLPARARNSIQLTIMVNGENQMDEGPNIPLGSRRNEDIALDMMKFIAMTTGYGKGIGAGVGFQGTAALKPEDYAAHLLELYGRCLGAVQGRK